MCICVHTSHVLFVYLENIFGRTHKKLVIVAVSGERNDRG